ncbi:MAG: phosphate signaling complex protein PhoU [Dehalococcoidia bacterium]|nr:phosphate signaling complex protein PhoU [Dehalococcoidia bacterium]
MPREEFDRRLGALEDSVLEMGAMVDRQIERSLQSLVERDTTLAEAVVRDDVEVNRARFRIDNECLSVLAQEAPLAKDLRVVVSVMAIAAELERMGDHAEGNAAIVLLMQDEPFVKPLVDIPKMAQICREMLRESLEAFTDRDVDKAFAVGRRDDAVDELQDIVYHDLVRIMIKNPSTVEPCTHLLWVAHNMERIADRATNIAERVVFTVTGALPEMQVSNY